jgi:hypothetical protein
MVEWAGVTVNHPIIIIHLLISGMFTGIYIILVLLTLMWK